MISNKDRAQRFKDAREIYNIHGKQSIKEVFEGTGRKIQQSMISDLESFAGNPRPVQYPKIVTLAEYYGVNISWLMGQPNTSPRLDEDSQIVTKMTGLSPKAIENLQKIGEYYPDYIDILNCILENKDTVKVLELISIAIQKLNDANTNGQSWDDIGSITMNVKTMQVSMDGKETAKYMMHLSVDTTKNIYESILRNVWESKEKEDK